MWSLPAFLILSGIVIASCGSTAAPRSTGLATPGIHLASKSISADIEVAYAKPVASANEKEQLSLFNTKTGLSPNIGKPNTYADVVLSPTGRYLAATIQAETRTAVSSLLLYNTASGYQATYTEPQGLSPSLIVWSPNGQYIALVGTNIIILNTQMHAIASTETPPGRSTSHGGTVENGGGYQWSSDSTKFTELMNGYLLTAYTDGHASSAVPTTASSLAALGILPPPAPSVQVHIPQGKIQASTVWTKVSTDGSAIVSLSRLQGTVKNQVLTVRIAGKSDVIDIPYQTALTRDGALLSVAVIS